MWTVLLRFAAFTMLACVLFATYNDIVGPEPMPVRAGVRLLLLVALSVGLYTKNLWAVRAGYGIMFPFFAAACVGTLQMGLKGASVVEFFSFPFAIMFASMFFIPRSNLVPAFRSRSDCDDTENPYAPPQC